MANEGADIRGSKLAECGERVGHKLDEIATDAQELYGRGRERAVEWKDNVSQYVQDRPMKSVLIAAGVGLALGALLTRR